MIQYKNKNLDMFQNFSRPVFTDEETKSFVNKMKHLFTSQKSSFVQVQWSIG